MSKKRILIMDDDADLVRIVEARLKSAGYEVLSAGGGAECLEKAQKEMPDIILLDILMPEMDGQEVLRKLRSGGRAANIPVIMLTAKDQVEDVTKSIRYGAQDYIVKPFDYRVMLEKIKKVIEG